MHTLSILSARTIAGLVIVLMATSAIFVTAARSQSVTISAYPEVRLSNSVIHPGDISPPSNIIAYSFDDVEFDKLRNDADIGVIIHHGKPLTIDGYKIVYSHSETLPLYINQKVGVAGLSAAQSKDILAGEAKNWADLGGSDLPINIYVPSAEIKKKALAFQLIHAGSTLLAPVRSSGPYDYLARKLREDPGAIVLGLRSEPARTENLAGAMRVEPESESGRPMFDVPIYLYVRNENPEAQAAAKALLQRVAKRAAEDGMTYPLAERLDEILR